jgi:membrane-associated HD superfamily phosphohydrolase
MARRKALRSPTGESLSDRIRYHAIRWLPLLATALLTYALFPPPAAVLTRVPDVGQRADRTVVAPFPYQVRKSTDELAREGEARALTAQPVYRFSPTAYDSALAAARDFFTDLDRAGNQGPELTRAVATQAHLGPEEIRYLADSANRRAMRELVTHFLGESLSRGVADAGVIRGEPSRQITLRRNDAERVVARDSVLTFADLMEQSEAAASVIEDPVGQRTLRRLVGTFYHPTIVPDPLLTSARRERLRASVEPVRFGVRSGERIIVAGQVVTEDQQAKLIGLHQELERRGTAGFWTEGAVGGLLYNTLVLSVFWLLIMFYRRDTYAEVREMWFFGALFVLVVLITAGTTQLLPIRPEMVPIPFAAILVTLLYDGRIGVFSAVTLAVLLDGQWALRESGILLFGLMGGVAGAIGIRAVRRRRHLYVTVAVVAAASMLASLTIGLLQGWGTITIVASAFLGSLMALATIGYLGPQPGHGEPVRVRVQHHRGERPARAGGMLLSRHREAHGAGLLRGEPGRRPQSPRPAAAGRIGAHHPAARAGWNRAGRDGWPAGDRALVHPRAPRDDRDHLLPDARASRVPQRGAQPGRVPVPRPATAAGRDRGGHAGRLGGGGDPGAARSHARQGARGDRPAGAAEARLRAA